MFETERLILRVLTENDVERIFALRGDAEMMRFIREPQNRAESENWIKLISSRWETDKIGFCGIVEKSSNELIGWCGLWLLEESGEIETGYAIEKKFWGKGFAVEAAERILQYGFDELKLEKIVAVARPENNRSRRVMEKLGMKYDGIGRFYKSDLVHYTIKRDDYFQSRQSDDLHKQP